MRNKNKLTLGLGAALILFMAFSVQAQTRSNESQRLAPEPVKTPREQRLQSVKRLMGTQVQRSQKHFEKLSNIHARIKLNYEKLQGEEKDLAEIKRLLLRADTSQIEVGELIGDLASYTNNIDKARAPKTTVRVYMQSVNNLKKELIEYHKNLLAVVRAMKSLEQEKETN